MESTTSFGYWIRWQRKALDLTQQALAERVGCTPTRNQEDKSNKTHPPDSLPNGGRRVEGS